MGNMTGAMVFQSSFPVTIGLLLTPWVLAGTALVAALVALAAGGVLWLTLRISGRFSAPLLLFQGVFYVGYVDLRDHEGLSYQRGSVSVSKETATRSRWGSAARSSCRRPRRSSRR